MTELGARGVTLFTRYGAGNTYLGDLGFDPVFNLLDELEAVVFVHPTHPVDTTLVNGQLPQPIVDYPHETTRAAVDMITAGIMEKYKKCKIILSHAGGTLPFLAYRAAHTLQYMKDSTIGADDFLRYAKRFYFDTALSTPRTTMQLLQAFAAPGHVIYGSDYPYAPETTIRTMNVMLDDYASHIDGQFVHDINFKSGLALFPGL